MSERSARRAVAELVDLKLARLVRARAGQRGAPLSARWPSGHANCSAQASQPVRRFRAWHRWPYRCALHGWYKVYSLWPENARAHPRNRQFSMSYDALRSTFRPNGIPRTRLTGQSGYQKTTNGHATTGRETARERARAAPRSQIHCARTVVQGTRKCGAPVDLSAALGPAPVFPSANSAGTPPPEGPQPVPHIDAPCRTS